MRTTLLNTGKIVLLLLVTVSVASAEPVEKKPACKPERWNKAIEKFLQADEKKAPAPGSVLFVGSSSIRLWDLPKYFPRRQNLINRGFGGSELCDAVHHFDALVAKHQPKVVVLYAGDNDVAGGKQAKQVHADFLKFDRRMKDKLPDTKLMFISIKPSIARWKLADEMIKANELIAAECKKQAKRLVFIDIWQSMLGKDGEPNKELFVEDGLHMNDKGYRIWANKIRQRLVYWAP